MRVVSPLHVASPQLHSPEVSSTVSTPAASADKGHHRRFIVQGLHSVNVAACALSSSDTESECSHEVAQINVFKDPNRCLPASRIPPPQISLEETEDNTECSTNGGEAKGEQEQKQGEQEQGEQEQGNSDHDSDTLPDTVMEDTSAQQDQSQKQVEEKQKVTPIKKATSKSTTRKSRVCMPRKNRAKRLKVEVESDDDVKAMVPEVQKPPLQKDSVRDVIVAVSPLAMRKRRWHNKTLSSDDEEDHKPSSVEKVQSPKKATSKEMVVLPSSQQGPEKPVEKPSPAKVGL